MPPAKRLRPLSRILALGVNLVLGLLPSFAFFIWIERNCSLPWVGLELGWPWLSIQERWPQAGPATLAAFDFLLVLAFGLTHSLAAQRPFYRAIERILPAQLGRTAYLVLTGLAAALLMGFWQNTGLLLWTLPLSRVPLNALSIGLYLFFLSFVARFMTAFDALEFVGLRQLYQNESELALDAGTNRQLNRTGWYGRVRHPMYLFTLLAVAVTPWMSLDRALVFGGLLAYLAFGIPMEERKLRTIFGERYDDYRKTVPMLFPRGRLG